MEKVIPFFKSYLSGDEQAYFSEALARGDFAGSNGHFTRLCETQLQALTGAAHVLLTSSCTHALEMCFLLCKLEPGDEVIMPSFTFVSAANALVMRGAKPVFVDIRPDDLNINENLIEAAITDKTRAILVMHYGGAGCRMDRIAAIGKEHNLWVIEDAAHCIGAQWGGQPLGSFADLATLSFHATKNIHCGEGGALLINRRECLEEALMIRDKGTNRIQLLQGRADFYTWYTLGSSYACSELSAAFLAAQLPYLDEVNEGRKKSWHRYQSHLSAFAGQIELAHYTSDVDHNGHLFYIRTQTGSQRDALILFLKERGIDARFHYVPLHSSPGGAKFGRWHGIDVHTTVCSQTLVRLPLYYPMSEDDQTKTLAGVEQFLSCY